ncbi:hypothetical protein COCSADRAFT_75808, partial [Bipolaris sorokiniana ND90Pr]
RVYTSLSWSALRQVSITLVFLDHNECNNEIQPILISVAFGPAIPYFPAIPGMVVMLGMAAIPRRPAIPRMVALGGMAHHVT